MHIWVYHKKHGALSVFHKDAEVMFKSLKWFDNAACEPNEVQKKLMAIKETEKELENVRKEKGQEEGLRKVAKKTASRVSEAANRKAETKE